VPAPDVEAVLTPAGDVDHAEGGARSLAARQVLKLAVRQRERNRTARPADAERTVRVSKGLVDAQWTLVDHHETDGKRYVLARENAPRPPARRGCRCVSNRSWRWRCSDAATS
jgi:hypothetical protein